MWPSLLVLSFFTNLYSLSPSSPPLLLTGRGTIVSFPVTVRAALRTRTAGVAGCDAVTFVADGRSESSGFAARLKTSGLRWWVTV